MHFVFQLCVLVIVFVKTFEGAPRICKVPNGDAGTCIEISKCKPLSDIYNKRPKTKGENQYIAQAYCGYQSSPKIKVCCPDESTWDSFIANPVVYERPPLGNNIERGPVTAVTAPSLFKPLPEPSTIEPAAIPLKFTPNLIDNKQKEEKTVDFKNEKGCGAFYFSSNKITGGEPTAIDQYPWLVLLEYSGGLLGCGGSLITSRLVLTAAHCLDGISGIPKTVHLAEYNITSFPKDFVEVEGGGFDEIDNILIDVETAVKHPKFSRSNLVHDIGIVKLVKDVVFSDFIKLVCLPVKDYVPDFTAKTNFTVAGWGDEAKTSEFYDVKKEVTVPYVPLSGCQKESRILTDNQICAGGEEGKDTCKGDSGGPLMYEFNNTYILVGVVSYGPRNCGTKGQPAVYTHVYKYLDWISETIAKL